MLAHSLSLGALALASVASAQTPNVSLLIDNPFYYDLTRSLNVRSLLPFVSARKGAAFHWGSTYSPPSTAETNWTSEVFLTYFAHMRAENLCNGFPIRCGALRNFPHNTFWHNQLPAWLPGNVTAYDLVHNVIPLHVGTEIKALGWNVTSWDVTNELISDTATYNMTSWECVQNADRWPTVTYDGGSTPLVTNLSFAYATWQTALMSASPETRLSYNDYSTGAQDAKTECVFKLIADLNANASIPYNRMAVGFQSHVGAQPGYFVPKAELEITFARLAALGVESMVTEMDLWIQANDTVNQRYQAAIWGDYLDACLYASNCYEFINWDNRDDTSWILPGDGHGVAIATLFDMYGNPKPVTYEIMARFARYAEGAAEMCATALGTESCTVY
ncbi:glycoside hydrolase [Dacryopinax primogenitus]|uniref:Glycoside hydrolase n=1 Tax=Dacryopinax primogenitus (strain DJM 731) TaxID=1858805 RepID=M5G3H6_DACPD|nr:glycoside hydrolase [Dacryopinax primogenitus]EJT98312.1 glycoside hydrolase [Dacryopinax primogenitus]